VTNRKQTIQGLAAPQRVTCKRIGDKTTISSFLAVRVYTASVATIPVTGWSPDRVKRLEHLCTNTMPIVVEDADGGLQIVQPEVARILGEEHL
jgi:hypothetical protein